jgi:hypothetical protein
MRASRARGTDPEAFLSDPTRSHGNSSSGAGVLSGELAEWLEGAFRQDNEQGWGWKWRHAFGRLMAEESDLACALIGRGSVPRERNAMERMKETCG